MLRLLSRIRESRFWALVVKELHQIRKNKQLVFLLLVPPTLQLLIYGFALNPEVTGLPLGILDYSQTSISRELIAALTENEVFLERHHVLDEEKLADLVSTGQVTAGVLIPPNFQEQIKRGSTAEIQVFIDGVDANTAGIASGYISQIVNQFVRDQQPRPQTTQIPRIHPEVTFLYNPGLRSSWFFVPGMIGVVLTLTGSLVSAVTVVKEKDSGTLEQLLMTPAAGWEILLAKIAPLFVLLMGDVVLALGVARGVFQVPFQGSFILFFALSGLYISVGIGVGILLATISANQQQAVLTSFFFNLPLVQLSGAIAPIESMPDIFRYGSLINPLRHYITCARGILLKGVGISVLWPHILALVVIGGVLLSLSTLQFRKQLN
jgi:ABC-2 type transport system permease protein